MYYSRYYNQISDKLLQKDKVLVIYGPRRVGKTTLIENILKDYKGKYYYGVGEDINLRNILESQNLNLIKNSFTGYDLVVIDEAQTIKNIGVGLKMLVDHLKDVTVIASGSSSFDLSNKIGEPLTGRKRTIKLYPMSAIELAENTGRMEIYSRLEEMLIFGTYPEILNASNNKDKQRLLEELRDSYLYKEILELENIRNSSKIYDLLLLLAYQVGKEVSLNELSNSLDLAKQTVERYIDLLEKSFVIKKVRGFSRNLRKEVTKTLRYYFLDNGILNAVINNFNPINLRNDTGALWENYLFSERLKKQEYHGISTENYFWRTYDRKEIDHVEVINENISGYEFKWKKGKIKVPALWKETYPDAGFEIINKENFLDFIL